MFKTLEFKFSHPTSTEPLWKDKVERWYQLDAPAFGLAEFYWQNREQLKAPDMMILASPNASNQTDHAFVKGGCLSPAKFVHTLPSVRISSLCQVMGWSGPVICVQKDPKTVSTALLEASQWQKNGASVWVLAGGAFRGNSQSNNYFVHAFLFDAL